MGYLLTTPHGLVPASSSCHRGLPERVIPLQCIRLSTCWLGTIMVYKPPSLAGMAIDNTRRAMYPGLFYNPRDPSHTASPDGTMLHPVTHSTLTSSIVCSEVLKEQLIRPYFEHFLGLTPK